MFKPLKPQATFSNWSTHCDGRGIVKELMHYSRNLREELFYKDKLAFYEYVGLHNLNARDLIFYPELCCYLRKDTYPTFRKSYKINPAIFNGAGIEKVAELLNHLNSVYQKYKSEKLAIEQRINSALHFYGQHKLIPRLEAHKCHYEVYDYDDKKKRLVCLELTFSGVKYHIDHKGAGCNQSWDAEKNQLYVINPNDLLSEEDARYYRHCLIKGGFIDSPVLQLHINSDTWRNKGHRIWVDINTGEVTRSKYTAFEYLKRYTKKVEFIEFE